MPPRPAIIGSCFNHQTCSPSLCARLHGTSTASCSPWACREGMSAASGPLESCLASPPESAMPSERRRRGHAAQVASCTQCTSRPGRARPQSYCSCRCLHSAAAWRPLGHRQKAAARLFHLPATRSAAAVAQAHSTMWTPYKCPTGPSYQACSARTPPSRQTAWRGTANRCPRPQRSRAPRRLPASRGVA